MTSASAPRGPSGTADFPPPDFASRPLPLEEVASGTPLHRIHRSSLGAIFFGPGPGKPPAGRFDSASGRVGVLYAGLTPEGALVETLVRNPAFEVVEHEEVATRSLSAVSADRALRLARLYGAGLSRLGLRNDISTGPYEPCGAWADALWDHPEAPDGLLYHSRHDPQQICMALFDRRSFTLSVDTPRDLGADIDWVKDRLARYGKRVLAPRP